jgi:hypothetical protein
LLSRRYCCPVVCLGTTFAGAKRRSVSFCMKDLV